MKFGFFAGLPYSGCDEVFETYRSFKNAIPKAEVLAHMKEVEFGLTSLPSLDLFTGEPIHAGMCWDGEFTFPHEFIHYYEKYDIGIPPEYEAYLNKIGVGGAK